MYLDHTLYEVYFGKQPELRKIETLIGKARNKFMGSNYIGGAKINSLKEITDINKALEDFFGFEIFALTIIPSNIMNAMTMPLSMAIDIAPQYRLKKNLIADSSGFKFNKEAKYCCTVFIYSGLFFNKDFSDAEMMALILHEIGHNFQTVINKDLYYFTDVTMVLKYISIFLSELLRTFDLSGAIGAIVGTALGSSNIFKTFQFRFNDIIRKSHPNLAIVAGMCLAVNGAISDTVNDIYWLLGEISKYGSLPINIVGQIIRKLTNPLGKTGEQVSDTFAAVYGYSAELSSALVKFDSGKTGQRAKDFVYDIPLFGTIVAAYDLPYDIIVTAFDEHDPAIKRMALLKSGLETELKRADIAPKLRDKIKDDISAMDIELTKYKKLSESTIPKATKLAWYRYLFEFTGDSKEAKKAVKINKDMNDIYDSIKLR